MRAACAVLVLVAGACDGKAPAEPLPKLDIDIEVTATPTEGGEAGAGERSVRVSITDLGAGCAHDDRMRPEPGRCGRWSDVIGPDCGSWHCLHEVRVEHLGGVLAKERLPPGPDRFRFMMRGTELVLRIPAQTRDARVVIEGCGRRAEVPISTELPAAPVVTRATRGPEGFEVAWTGAEDAAMLEVYAGYGFGGDICAQRERTPARFPPSSRADLSGLAARSAIVEHATPFGTAHVWRVDAISFPGDLFPESGEADAEAAP